MIDVDRPQRARGRGRAFSRARVRPGSHGFAGLVRRTLCAPRHGAPMNDRGARGLPTGD